MTTTAAWSPIILLELGFGQPVPTSLMPNPTGWREAWPTPSEVGGQASAMIPIGDGLALDERELEESFIRASGPGGQNVNKVASAVQLRFDLRQSRSLPEPVRMRLARLAGRRVSQDGVLVITAQRYRSQERNRADALARLVALIRRAAAPPRPRRPTRPSAASRERRLAGKARRARLKQQRGVRSDEV